MMLQKKEEEEICISHKPLLGAMMLSEPDGRVKKCQELKTTKCPLNTWRYRCFNITSSIYSRRERHREIKSDKFVYQLHYFWAEQNCRGFRITSALPQHNLSTTLSRDEFECSQVQRRMHHKCASMTHAGRRIHSKLKAQKTGEPIHSPTASLITTSCSPVHVSLMLNCAQTAIFYSIKLTLKLRTSGWQTHQHTYHHHHHHHRLWQSAWLLLTTSNSARQYQNAAISPDKHNPLWHFNLQVYGQRNTSFDLFMTGRGDVCQRVRCLLATFFFFLAF